MPRAVLRRMGELGFLGIRYETEFGGSEMDTLATVVLAEELGRLLRQRGFSPMVKHRDLGK